MSAYDRNVDHMTLAEIEREADDIRKLPLEMRTPSMQRRYDELRIVASRMRGASFR